MIEKGFTRTLAFAFSAIGVLVLFLASCGVSTTNGTSSDSRKSNIIDYVGNYNATVYPQSELEAFFTTDDIIVDGVIDAAYADVPRSAVDNFKARTENTDYVYAAGFEPSGVLKAV